MQASHARKPRKLGVKEENWKVKDRMNMKSLGVLLSILCIFQTAAVSAGAQRRDAGLDLTEQSFAYSGDLDAVYEFTVSSDPVSPKSTNTLHMLVKNGDFRVSFKAYGLTMDTIVTKGRTLSQQGSVKYNFNKPHPDSLFGMPALPVNFAAFDFLKVKPDGYYLLQAGSSQGLSTADAKIPAGTFFDRNYFAANVDVIAKDGLPQVRAISVGSKAFPLQAYRFSDHRKVGHVWIPGRIEWRVLSSSPPVTYVYTLKSLHTTAAAETLNYDRALKKGDLVQSDNGKSVISFTYDPSRSLEEQHAVAWTAEQKIASAVANEQKQRRYNSSILLTILGLGLLLFWYVRRRMNRAGNETPYSGEQTGV